jgi:hypothetical protein
VISRDGVPIPTSTLLVRVTTLAAAPDALRAVVGAVADDASVAWIGEVAGDVAQPLAAAVMRTVDGIIEVGPWHSSVEDPDGWLASRLLRAIADAGAARGDWHVRLPDDPALTSAAEALGWRSASGSWTTEA